jgi:hypothetical protein
MMYWRAGQRLSLFVEGNVFAKTTYSFLDHEHVNKLSQGLAQNIPWLPRQPDMED